MRTADVHSHVIPAGFIERVRSDGAGFGYALRMNGEGIEELITPNWPAGIVKDVGQQILPKRSNEDHRRAEMARAGIDASIEGILPPLMSYGATEEQGVWGAQAFNDGLAEDVRRFPGQVYGMAHVPLQHPWRAIRELERVAQEHGFHAVQIGSNVNGENLDLPELDSFWDAAQSLGFLVFIHPHQQAARERLSRYWLQNLIGNPLETSIAGASLIFGGVLERFPELRVCLAHAGGYAPWIRGRWRHGAAVRTEARERGALGDFEDYFAKLYFDTIIHDARALRFLIETVGADRVLHGTDYAADMGDWNQVNLICGLDEISDDDKEMILGGTVLRLIGETP